MDLDEGPDGLEEESFETEEKKTMSTRSRTHSRSRSRSVTLVAKKTLSQSGCNFELLKGL